MGGVVKKVALVGKATTFAVGLVVVLALTVGLASSALAGTGVGATFNLGNVNSVDAISQLVGSVAGPSLQIDNNSTGKGATALDLQTEAGRPPLKVNSDARVVNLNADEVDGRDSTSFATAVNGKATDADKLDGLASTELQGLSEVSARSVSVFTQAGANGSGVARCLPGEVATGGGVDLLNGNVTKIHYFEPGGIPVGGPPNGWEAGWFAEIDTEVRVVVVCAS